METLPILRRNGFFKALLSNADAVEEVCLDYLGTANVPNIPGLCAKLGTSPQNLKKLFSLPPDDPGRPSEDIIEALATTILTIESNIVENGLSGQFNAHMSKFVLSAFHERHEKHLQQSSSDNVITVRVESHQPTTLEELKEYQRLEAALQEQSAIELAAMGKTTSVEGAAGNPDGPGIRSAGRVCSVASSAEDSIRQELELLEDEDLI